MTLSVLDRRDEVAERALAGPLSLGELHDTVTQVTGDLPCRANDPELWFAESPSDVELAKALCVDCPVRSICLDGALERREPWGVWGGELFLQGTVIPRKRPRGRPRKDAALTEPVRAEVVCTDPVVDRSGRDDDEVAA
jgi:WhiB family redox-sensing transcriptional regulator